MLRFAPTVEAMPPDLSPEVHAALASAHALALALAAIPINNLIAAVGTDSAAMLHHHATALRGHLRALQLRPHA